MSKKINIGLSFGAISAILIGSTMFANAQALTRQLQLGMSGADVTELQTFLAKNPTFYPSGLVTGYFGTLTKAAVARFQSANGISAIGRVGPQTLAAINAQLGNAVNTNPSGVNPISGVSITNNGSGMVTINWTTPVATRATVYYSTTPLSTYENDNSVTISGSTATASNYQTTQSLQISGLSTGTTYYYTIYTTDQNGNVNMTWPSTFRTN